jgi:hypothetical protein
LLPLQRGHLFYVEDQHHVADQRRLHVGDELRIHVGDKRRLDMFEMSVVVAPRHNRDANQRNRSHSGDVFLVN